MGRFTKRPVTIDAILASEVLDGASSGRFSVKSEDRIALWIVEAFERGVLGFESSLGHEVVLINTQGHGQVRAERTDWIIRGVGSRRPVTLPGPRLERTDPVAIRTSDLAGMTFDLIAGSSDRLDLAEIDRLPVHVVNIEGYSVLAVPTVDAAAIELVRRDPRLHLTDANVRLGVHLLTVSGTLQTLPAPGSSLFPSGRGPRWTCSVPTEIGAESSIKSFRLERGAALSADEIMQHRWMVPDIYPCKPDIFEATYDPGEGRQPPVAVLQLKGNMPPEQFKKFREEWDASHRSVSRAMIFDSQVQLTDTDVELLREVATRDTLGEGYGLAINKLLGGGAADVQPPPTPWPGSNPNKVVDQPPPIPQTHLVPVWFAVISDMELRFGDVETNADKEALYRSQEVITDMRERDRIGRERYGVPLTTSNGRDQVVDAYQELLDAAVYLRAAIMEGTPISQTIYNHILDDIVWMRTFIHERELRKV